MQGAISNFNAASLHIAWDSKLHLLEYRRRNIHQLIAGNTAAPLPVRMR